MKDFLKGYGYMVLWTLAIVAFILNQALVGFALFALSIPIIARLFVQADKRDKLLKDLVAIIDEKTELEEMLPLLTDKATADKVASRLAEIEIEIKVPIDGLVAIGFLKKEVEA